MGAAEATGWVCGYTAIGTAATYYGGRYGLRWLNRGIWRIGPTKAYQGYRYFSFRYEQYHLDFFKIPKWFFKKLW